MLEQINRVATPILLLCALVLTSAIVRREVLGAGRAADRRPAPPMKISNWKAIADSGTRIGSSAAPLTIIEYSDFQCPWCKRFHESLEQALEKYGDKVSVSYRHLPIDRIHKAARATAIASECAARDGRFADFAHVAFAEQDSLGKLSVIELGRRAGIKDTLNFSACLSNPAIAARVEADVASAKALNINGTPTVFLNDKKIGGAVNFARLDSLITKELAGIRK